MRRADGQILPGLVILLLAVLALGVVFFQVGKAAVLRSDAQTAADAAALAAARNVQQQLMAQVAATGTSDLSLIDSAAVTAAAADYARRNGGHLTRPIERNGVDVKVWAATDQQLDRTARQARSQGREGEAHARARVQLVALAGGAGGNLGPSVGGGDPKVRDDEWKKLKGEISHPPTCGTSKETNDLVKLGELLRSHGFLAGENADLGDNPAPGVHSSTGYHYRCRNSAAIDLNWPNAAQEPAVLDALVKPIQDLGFRTIWRAAGHFDHMHIDVANSGPIGAGFGNLGGAVGPLEETGLSVKLIDWNAAIEPFGGLGGLGGGGFFGGKPDPAVAHAICSVLDGLGANPKVRLAAFEAAIVESGVHNLSYGDGSSVGVFQQIDNGEWGTLAQRMDPVHASRMFVSKAIAWDQGWMSAGQLAQRVQRSAFPDRYDGVAGQAAGLLQQFCGGGS